jgi:hypothetical protein
MLITINELSLYSLFPFFQVFHMLKNLDPELINQVTPRRELLFLSCLPVTPNCHRVAEMQYGHSDGPRMTGQKHIRGWLMLVRELMIVASIHSSVFLQVQLSQAALWSA